MQLSSVPWWAKKSFWQWTMSANIPKTNKQVANWQNLFRSAELCSTTVCGLIITDTNGYVLITVSLTNTRKIPTTKRAGAISTTTIATTIDSITMPLLSLLNLDLILLNYQNQKVRPFSEEGIDELLFLIPVIAHIMWYFLLKISRSSLNFGREVKLIPLIILFISRTTSFNLNRLKYT